MPEPLIVCSRKGLRLQATDPIFAHGFGLFETLKLQAGRLCFWEQHWQRMIESSCGAGARPRLFAGRPAGGRPAGSGRWTARRCHQAFAGPRGGRRAVVCLCAALPAGGQTLRLAVAGAAPLNEASPLAGHKTHNYMENCVLLEQCHRAGFDDVLRSNCAGAWARQRWRTFSVSGTVVWTPSLCSGALPGIMRAGAALGARSLAALP